MTLDEIQRRLQEACQRRFGVDPESCFMKGPLAVRDNSNLFYAECSAFPSPLAVKLCLKPHTSEPDSTSAQSQYDALHRVSQAMGEGTEYSVPQPHLVQADIGLLAMEWITGKSMTDLVFSRHCKPAQAQQLIARAGRWLRHFHACHPLTPARLDIEEKLAFVAEMASAGAVSDRVFIHGLVQLRESAKHAAAVTLNRSWIHGDFKTDNLIISGARTIGIDIHLRQEALVIYDLAPFLNHLELHRYHPNGWRLSRSQALLQETFLVSYLEGGGDAIATPLAWVRLYMILASWYSAHTHSVSWGHLRFLHFCYRGVASRLISRVSRQGSGYA